MRARKPHRKIKPANEVSDDEINALLLAVKSYDGYPKLKDLSKMVSSLTPLKINVIVRYLERSGAIIVDSEGYIIWSRKEHDHLSLGEVAEMSNDLKDFLKRNPEH